MAANHSVSLATPVIAGLTVTALYFMADVAIPISVAVLLTFVLAPVIGWLERRRIQRVPAVLLVVGALFLFVVFIGSMLAGQLVDLANQLPQYRNNILRKAESFRRPLDGSLSRVTQNLKEISKELSGSSETTQTLTVTKPVSVPRTRRLSLPEESPGPTRVELIDKPPNALGILYAVAEPIIQPLAQAGLVLILLIFMLIHREDLRDRLIALAGRGQLTITTQAMDEAGRRVSRYLLMQLIVNILYGVPTAVGLYLIGIPNAVLWGLLAIILRFIPYLGPWIAALLPILISLAIFEDWLHPLMTVGLFVVLELISNNIIEPRLYSAGTGVSVVALLVAAAFWTWMWGAVGLMLSAPLTVCLMVLGCYVPQLEYFYVLLGDQPALDPSARLYQRLLATDMDNVTRLLDSSIGSSSFEQVYDDLLLPVLRSVQQDHARGLLDTSRVQFVLGGLKDIVEDLGDRLREQKLSGASASEAAGTAEESRAQRTIVLCLAARDEADEIAAIMLTQLLEAKGHAARLASFRMLTGEVVSLVAQEGIRIVFVAAFPPLAELHARYICKRLRARHANLRIVTCLWSLDSDARRARERVGDRCTDHVVNNFTLAMQYINQVSPSLLIEEQMLSKKVGGAESE